MAARAGPTPLTYVSGVVRSSSGGKVRKSVYNAGSEAIIVFLLLMAACALERGAAPGHHRDRHIARHRVHQNPERRDVARSRAGRAEWWRLTRAAARTSSRAPRASTSSPKSCARSGRSKLCRDIPTLCKKVDAVLIESVDGRVHLEQAKAVIAADKPMFIDKPLAVHARRRARDRAAGEGSRRALVQLVQPALRRDRRRA